MHVIGGDKEQNNKNIKYVRFDERIFYLFVLLNSLQQKYYLDNTIILFR